MQWLNKIVDELVAAHPEGEILVESGGSPSGTYHFGHLRELVICDAIMLELRRRERSSSHIYYVDDLDALRKIPPNVPADYEKYLGVSLCDIPAPNGGQGSYADYFIKGLEDASNSLGIELEFMRSHEKYRSGFFTEAIEKALENSASVRETLENVSGHKLGDDWSPIQINEGGYLKKRPFENLDKETKKLTYLDKDGNKQDISYAQGEVKLDWRIDWPARWWLLKIDVEPAGRDHSTKGGSFDTGLAICKNVFGVPGPLPVQYDFINLTGDNKKMSASAGTGLDAAASAQIMPPEVLRFFILRAVPLKRLYFDPQSGVSLLIDEYAQALAKNEDSQLLEISRSSSEAVISQIPFSHLVASYQAALGDSDKTIDLLKRTGYGDAVEKEQEVIQRELAYARQWLDSWAPEDVKFSIANNPDFGQFTDVEKAYFAKLADKIANAPEDADGQWFHAAIYELQKPSGLDKPQLFSALYRLLISKQSGPRAGWFLSILDRDWLLNRLRLES